MKKRTSLIAILLAAMLSAAACGNSPEPAPVLTDGTEEIAAEPATTTKAVETTAGAETPEEPVSFDIEQVYKDLRENAPLYDTYLNEMSTFPVNAKYSYINEDGELCIVTTMIVSPSLMLLSAETDSSKTDFVIKDHTYNIVSHADATIYRFELSEADEESTERAILSSYIPAFDTTGAKYVTEEVEHEGVECIAETITLSTGDSIKLYKSKTTEDFLFIDNGGEEFSIMGITHDVDESLIFVPEGYTVIKVNSEGAFIEESEEQTETEEE